jgi:hypothetical protein
MGMVPRARPDVNGTPQAWRSRMTPKPSQQRRKVLHWTWTGPSSVEAPLTSSSANAGSPAAEVVEFAYDGLGTYSGVGPGDRQWQIVPIVTGWRLEFRDPGDHVATYAGSHKTLNAARAEAARVVSPPSRQAQHRRSGMGSRSVSEPVRRPAPLEPVRADFGRRHGGGRRDGDGRRHRSGGGIGGDRRRTADRRRGDDDDWCGVDRRQHVPDRRQGEDRRGADPHRG